MSQHKRKRREDRGCGQLETLIRLRPEREAQGDPPPRRAVPPTCLFVCSCLSSSLRTSFPSSAGDPGPANKPSASPPASPRAPPQPHRAPRSGPSGPACSEEVGSRPRTCPRGVGSGSSTSGSSSCSMSLAERVGREVDPRLPAPPRPRPGVGAHQSIAASMPWFPVRARAFSLGAETP